MAQSRRRGRLARLALAAAAIGLFVIAYQWGGEYRRSHGTPPVIAGARVRPPQALPPALAQALDALPAQEGPPQPELDRPAWTLLAFAGRPDGPSRSTTRRLVEVYNRLADRPELRRAMRLVLITADEPADALLALEQLAPSFQLLSLDAAAHRLWHEALGMAPDEDPSAAPLFLIDEQAHLTALFPGSQAAASVADDLRALIDAERT